MKKSSYLLFVAIAAIALGTAAPLFSADKAQPEPPGDKDKYLRDLKAKVEQLEHKTAELQKQIDELRLQQRAASVTLPRPPATPLVNPPTPKPEIPPGWSPRQFNGQTYYLVPLDQKNQPTGN